VYLFLLTDEFENIFLLFHLSDVIFRYIADDLCMNIYTCVYLLMHIYIQICILVYSYTNICICI
jgi:hypothetical protein